MNLGKDANLKKNVWILNHYAGNQYFDKGGRHYAFSKFLKREGYNPVVFCSNAQHWNTGYFFETNLLANIRVAEEIGVPFIFVKSREYTGNGKSRILNMVDFYRNTNKSVSYCVKKFGKPDIIYASSVHPLTLVAGIKIAKKLKIKCVCEVRDLWPESLVAYGVLKKNSPLAKLLYIGEKWIYKKADKIVMTWPGGYDYIVNQGWEKIVPKSKVEHISNGVDLEEYEKYKKLYPYVNDKLSACNRVRFVYTGAIRKVNNLRVLVDAVALLKKQNVDDFVLFVFGDGEERDSLEKLTREKQIDNVLFMGKVSKVEVPSILCLSDINILHNSSTSLDKYGQSQNKFFEYLASGRPILMTYSVGHSIVKAEKCGIEIEQQNPQAIADALKNLCHLGRDEIEYYSKNARRCAEQFDYRNLTKKLITTIEAL